MAGSYSGRLQYRRDGLREVANIVGCHACDIDTARIYDVDAEVFLQRVDLRRTDAQKTEHARCTNKVREIMVGRFVF